MDNSLNVKVIIAVCENARLLTVLLIAIFGGVESKVGVLEDGLSV